MRFRGHNIPRAVALALTATVGACATPPQPAVVAASTSAAPTGSGFDGTYRGEASPDQIISGCGESSRAINIEVRGNHIWTHHSHPSLDGTIDTSGEVAMQNSDRSSNLTGLIQGDTLTATETTSDGPKKLQGFYEDAQSTCTFAVQATKESDGGADGTP